MISSPLQPAKSRACFRRWLLFTMTIWGIPAFLLWFGAETYFQTSQNQQILDEFDRLENQINELSQKCDPVDFFQLKIGKLFDTLKLSSTRRNLVEPNLQTFQKSWPEGMIDIFLFDGEFKLVSFKNPISEAQKFFDIIREPWTIPLTVSREEARNLGALISSPEPIIRYMKGRPGKIISLGGTGRFTWGYFDFLCDVQPNRIAGILVFIHKEILPKTLILDQVIDGLNSPSWGYILEDEKSRLPQGFSALSPKEILTKANFEPQNRFQLPSNLIVLKRHDNQTLLMGVAAVPKGPTIAFYWLTPIYLVASIFLLVVSYRKMVLSVQIILSLRQKILGLFTLGFALPIVTSAFLGSLYLKERREGIWESQRRLAFKKLTELDSGFQQYLSRRLLFYRNFIKNLKSDVWNPRQIVTKTLKLFKHNYFDTCHVISSQSTPLLTKQAAPIEIRRLFPQPLSQRTAVFNSWIERGFVPSTYDVRKITTDHPPPKTLYKDETGIFEKMLVKATVQAGRIAMEQFNLSNDRTSSSIKGTSTLAMEGIMENEATDLMMSARGRISSFIYLEGNKENGVLFLDVLPGPEGEAWYAFLFYHNLIALERAYLQRFFPKTSNHGLQPDSTSQMTIKAASTHVVCPNFPTLWEFKKYQKILRLMENGPSTLSSVMSIDGEDLLICAMKCSFMKQYVLISVLPTTELEARFDGVKTKVYTFMAGLLLFGISLAWIMLRRFLIPVSELSAGVKAMAEKDFGLRLPVRSDDELGHLCHALNKAIERLREMEVARTIQADLLPQKRMQFGNYAIVGKNIMTRSVGGDYFDFIQIRPDLIAIILGDVSGHGVSAALVGAMAKAAFSILCPRFPEQPEEVLKRINMALLTQLHRSKMMTCFLGILDPKNDCIFFSNAGQSYPLLVSKDGKAEYVKAPSYPLGVRAKVTFQKLTMDLKNRTLVLYSDGLIEAMNEQEKMFGYDSFVQTSEIAAMDSGKDIADSILEKVRAFSGSVPWADDVTIVVVQSDI